MSIIIREDEALHLWETWKVFSRVYLEDKDAKSS